MSAPPGPAGTRPTTAQLLVLPAAATAVGLVAGVLAAWCATSPVRSGGEPPTQFDDALGEALVQLAAGLGVGIGVLVTGYVVVARRLLPRGHRTAPVVVGSLAVVLGSGAFWLAGRAVPRPPGLSTTP